MSQDRLNEIEIKLAHHEQVLSDLNDVVLRQSREIEGLKAKLRLAEEKLADVSQSLQDGEKPLSATEAALRDKPPHY